MQCERAIPENKQNFSGIVSQNGNRFAGAPGIDFNFFDVSDFQWIFWNRIESDNFDRIFGSVFKGKIRIPGGIRYIYINQLNKHEINKQNITWYQQQNT